MAVQELAGALERVETVLRRRPDLGLHDDAPATVTWSGGLRMRAQHANGKQMLTDMPAELGGTGDQVTPGWLLRAGLASCAATCVAMLAAREGIELSHLELRASSRSDTRGMLGMQDGEGTSVPAGPRDMQLHVRIEALDVSAERLHDLVRRAVACSPVPCAVTEPVDIALSIDTGPG